MDRIDKGVLIFGFAILCFQLFLPPVTGLANNGDFGKLIARFNLGAPFEDEFRYAPITYTFDPKYHYDSGVYSSELMFVAIALGLHALISPTGNFDIRWIGAIHSAVFLLALYLLMPVLRNLAKPVRILLGALMLLVFLDVMYITTFNSFYMDAGAFLFLALGIVLFLRAMRSRTVADAGGFLICCVLLITTKTQHCLLGLPLGAFVVWKGSAIWPGRLVWFKSIAVSAMLCATIFTWRASPPNYSITNLYTMIFTGLLPGSKHVSHDLKALGLDDSYTRYVGTHGFSAGNPLGDEGFVRQFQERISYPRLGYFFLTNPVSACRITWASMGQAGRQKANLGNFDKSAGRPEWAESDAFALWSGLKKSVFYQNGGRYLWYCFVVGSFSALVAATRATKDYVAPAGLLIVLATVEMCVASLGDAVEVTRHFFLFNTLVDIILVSGIAVLLAAPSARDGLENRIRRRIACLTH